MKNHKIGFIGAGNIASAIIGGILKAGYIIPQNIYLFDTDTNKLGIFDSLGINISKDATSLSNSADFIFLTVKPQVYPTVLEEIKDHTAGKCVIDVAAGITINFIKQILGEDTGVIRAMPNTPLLVGHGATALTKASSVTDEQFAFIKGIFDSSGETVTVDERYINTVTAISGSSPAFILQFANCLIDYGVSAGLAKNDAEKLVLNTLIGAGLLALNSELDISKLIENVTSPGGTTQAGRMVLEDNGFEKLIKSCLDETVNRANQLTK